MNNASRAALLTGSGAAVVAADRAIRWIRPDLLTDPDPGWALARLLLGLGVIVAASFAAGLAAAAVLLFSRTRVASGRAGPLPVSRGVLLALAVVAIGAGASLRFAKLAEVPAALWIEDLTLIDPALALTGRLADFRNSIRPAPSGVSKPYGSVGVLYLELFRLSLRTFGPTVVGVRFLSALGGALSCVTAFFLARALLPRGGATLAAIVVGGLRWSLILSRWGYVAVLLVPISDAAALLLLRAMRRRSRVAAAGAGAVLGIGAHVYLSAWVALGALVLFALWPREDVAAGSARDIAVTRRDRVLLALALAAGFAVVASPLFLFHEGRVAPYFARAKELNVLREMRITKSPMPALAAAANALEAPWWRPDPSPWQDVPRSRLGWIVGIPVAVALARALLAPRSQLSAFLLSHAAAAGAAAVAAGTVMAPNGFRFAYLTTVTAVAAAAGTLALVSAVPPRTRRAASIAAIAAFCLSGILAARIVFGAWAVRLETRDGFSGHDNLLARAAVEWERLGRVEIDPRLSESPRAVDLVRSVQRASAAIARRPGPARVFRIAPASDAPAPGERVVRRIPDETGRTWAVVCGRREPHP